MEFLAISHGSELSWKHAPHQPSSLQMTAAAKLKTACRGTQGNCLHFPIISLATEMVRSQPTCSGDQEDQQIFSETLELAKEVLTAPKVGLSPGPSIALISSALSAAETQTLAWTREEMKFYAYCQTLGICSQCVDPVASRPQHSTSGEGAVVGLGRKGSHFLPRILTICLLT